QTEESELDVRELAESALRVMRGTAAASNVSLSAELDPALPRARGDGVRLRQVLLNLLANAVKFTPAGGSVTLTASVERPSGDLVVKVFDTGIGIPPGDNPR